MSFNTYWSDPHTVFNSKGIDGTSQIGKYLGSGYPPFTAQILFSPNGIYYYSAAEGSRSGIGYLNCISDSSNVYYRQQGPTGGIIRTINACLTNRKLITISGASSIISYDISLNGTLASTTNIQNITPPAPSAPLSVSGGNTSFGYIATDTSGLLLGTVKTASPPVAFFFKRINDINDSSSSNPWRNSHTSNTTYITDISSDTNKFANIAIADISFVDSSYGIARTYIERTNTVIREVRLYNISYSNISQVDITSAPTYVQTIDISNVARWNDIGNNGQWAINRTGTVLAVADPSYNDGFRQCGRILVYSPTTSAAVQLEIIEPNMFNLGRFIQIDKNTGWIYSQVSSLSSIVKKKDFLCGYELQVLNNTIYGYNQIFALELQNQTTGQSIRQVYYNISGDQRRLYVAFDKQAAASTGNIHVFPLQIRSVATDISQIIVEYPITQPYYLNSYPVSTLSGQKISIHQLLSSLQYYDSNNDPPGIIIYDISYGRTTTLRGNIIYSQAYETDSDKDNNITLADNSGILLPADASGGYIDIDPSSNNIVNVGGSSISFKFRAWDQTRGTKFQTINLSDGVYSVRSTDGRPGIIFPGTQDSPYSAVEGVFRTRVTYKPNLAARDISLSAFTNDFNIQVAASQSFPINRILTSISGDISSSGPSTIPQTFLDNMGIYIIDISNTEGGTFHYFDGDAPANSPVGNTLENAKPLTRFTRLRPNAKITYIQDQALISILLTPSIQFRLWTEAFDAYDVSDSNDILLQYNTLNSFQKIAYSDVTKKAIFKIVPATQLDISAGTQFINSYHSVGYNLYPGIPDGQNYVRLDRIVQYCISQNILNTAGRYNAANDTLSKYWIYVTDICGAGQGTFQYGTNNAVADNPFLSWNTINNNTNYSIINGSSYKYIRFTSTSSSSFGSPYIRFKIFEKDIVSDIITPIILGDNISSPQPPTDTNNKSYSFYTVNSLGFSIRVNDVSSMTVPQSTIFVNAPMTGFQQLAVKDVLSRIDISTVNYRDISGAYREPLNIVLTGVNRREYRGTISTGDVSFNNIVDTSSRILQASDTIDFSISGSIAGTIDASTTDISFRIMDSFGLPAEIPLTNTSGQFYSKITPITRNMNYGLSSININPVSLTGVSADVVQRSDGLAVNMTGTSNTVLRVDPRTVFTASAEILADITLTQDMSSINSMYNVLGVAGTLPSIQTILPLKPDLSWNGSQLVYNISQGTTNLFSQSCYATSSAYIDNGTLYMFGRNDAGQLGLGDLTKKTIPTINNFGDLSGRIPIQVSCGYFHTAVICSDGSICTFGQETNGKLGNNGISTNVTTPKRINTFGALSGKTPIQVACGYSHTAVLCDDASLCMFGLATNGRLGNGATSGDISNAVVINTVGTLAGKRPIQVSCGQTHTAVLCADASLCMFGGAANGRLGNGTTSGDISRAIVINRFGDLSGRIPIQVSCGNFHTAVLCADGSLHTFGAGAEGQMGDGSSVDRNVPTNISNKGDLSGRIPIQVSCGRHTGVICSDGTVCMFGYNNKGQLGLGSTGNISLPKKISFGSEFAGKIPVRISCEELHTIIIFNDGTICTFGDNTNGALGTKINSLTSNKSEFPLIINRPPLNTTFQLPPIKSSALMSYSPLANHSAVIANGLLYMFGYNANGQLGLNDINERLLPTINTFGDLSGRTPIQVSCGKSHTAVVCSDGTLCTFGYGLSGRLGNGQTVASNISGAVIINTGGLVGKRVIQAACGDSHTAVVCSDGTLCTFGTEQYGKLGNSNDSSNISTPVAINNFGSLRGRTPIQVACGTDHTGVLCSDGTIHVFGRNDKYQLGVSTPATSKEPIRFTQDLSGRIPIRVSCGTSYTEILCSDGSVFTFGLQTNGRLGNKLTSGNTATQQYINDIGTSLKTKIPIAISTGDIHSAVVCSNGSLCTFGLQTNGRLGNGVATAVDISSATNIQIPGGRSIIEATCGALHTIALATDGTVYTFGYYGNGRLGTNNTADQSTPTIINLTTAPMNAVNGYPLYKRCIMRITPAAFYLYSQNGRELFARGFDTQYAYNKIELGRDLQGNTFKFILHNIFSTTSHIPYSDNSPTETVGRVVRSYTNLPQDSAITVSADIYPLTTGQIRINFVPQIEDFSGNRAKSFIQYRDVEDASDTGKLVSEMRFNCISGGQSSIKFLPTSYTDTSSISIYITDISNRSTQNKFQYTTISNNPLTEDWSNITPPIELFPNWRIRYRNISDEPSQLAPILTYRLGTGHATTNRINVGNVSTYSSITVSGEVDLRYSIAIKPIGGAVDLSRNITIFDASAQSATGIKIADAADFWASNTVYRSTKDITDSCGVLITYVDPSCNWFIRPSGGTGSTDLSLNIATASGYIIRPTQSLFIKNLPTGIFSTTAKPKFNITFRLYSDISAGLTFVDGSTYALQNLNQGDTKRFSDLSAYYAVTINSRPVINRIAEIYAVKSYKHPSGSTPVDNVFRLSDISATDPNSDTLYFEVVDVCNNSLRDGVPASRGTFKWTSASTVSGDKSNLTVAASGDRISQSGLILFDASESQFTKGGSFPTITLRAIDVSSAPTAQNRSASNVIISARINSRPDISNSAVSYTYPTNVTYDTYRVNISDISAIRNTFTRMAPQSNHTMILDAAGRAWATGRNISGQCGVRNFFDVSRGFTQITLSGGRTATQIAAGDAYTLFLDSSNTVQGTGWNLSGRLGNALTTTVSGCINITLSGGRTAKYIATGSYHSVIIDASNQLQVFGEQANGRLGNRVVTVSGLTSPQVITTISGTAGDPVEVACGERHTLIRTSTNQLWAAGYNLSGLLGISGVTIQDVSNFTQVTLSGTPTISQIAAGFDYSAFITVDSSTNRLFMFGDASNGKIGNGNISGIVIRPTEISIPGKVPIYVACGRQHTAIVCNDGTVFTCGDRSGGKLGDNFSSGNVSTPAIITLSGSNKFAIGAAAGADHTIIYCSDGTVQTFGANSFYQLGISGDNGNKLSPQPVQTTAVLHTVSDQRIFVNFYDVSQTSYEYRGTTARIDPLNVSDLLRDISFTDINADTSGIAIIQVQNTPSRSGSGGWKYRKTPSATWDVIPNNISASNAFLLSREYQIALDCTGTDASPTPYSLQFRAWDSTLGVSGDVYDLSNNGDLDLSSSAFSQIIGTINSYVYQSIGAPTLQSQSIQNLLNVQISQNSIDGIDLENITISGLLSKLTFNLLQSQTNEKPIGIYFMDYSGTSNVSGTLQYKTFESDSWIDFSQNTPLAPTTRIRFKPNSIDIVSQNIPIRFRLWNAYISGSPNDLIYSRFYSTTSYSIPAIALTSLTLAGINSSYTIIDAQTIFNYYLPINEQFNRGIPFNIFKHSPQKLVETVTDFSANTTGFQTAFHLDSISGNTYNPTYSIPAAAYIPSVTLSGARSATITDNIPFTRIDGSATYINISGSPTRTQDIIFWFRVDSMRQDESVNICSITLSGGTQYTISVSDDPTSVYYTNAGTTVKTTISGLYDEDWNCMRFNCNATGNVQFSVNDTTVDGTSRQLSRTQPFNLQLGNNSALIYPIHYRDLYVYTSIPPSIGVLETYQKNAHIPLTKYAEYTSLLGYSLYITQINQTTGFGRFQFAYNSTTFSQEVINTSGYVCTPSVRGRFNITNIEINSTIPSIAAYIFTGNTALPGGQTIPINTSGQVLSPNNIVNIGNQLITINFPFKKPLEASGTIIEPATYSYKNTSKLPTVLQTNIKSQFGYSSTAAGVVIIGVSGPFTLKYSISNDPIIWKPIQVNSREGIVLPGTAYIDISLNSSKSFSPRDPDTRKPQPYTITYKVWNGQYSDRLSERYIEFNKYFKDDGNRDKRKDTDNREFNSIFSKTTSTYNIPIYPTVLL